MERTGSVERQTEFPPCLYHLADSLTSLCLNFHLFKMSDNNLIGPVWELNEMSS